MPRILLSLSVIFIIIAGVFSFQTKPLIEKIKAERAAAKTDASNTKKELAKTNDELKVTKELAANQKLRADTVEADRNSLRIELKTSQDQVKDANEKLARTAAEVEDLTQKLAAAGQTADGAASTAMIALQEKIKEGETKLGELETVNQSLAQKITDTENKLAAMQKAENSRQGRIMAQGLTGQVLAVNRTYNFIVISIGDKQGVVMNGEMVVKRGGSQVAKVKISSVEPTTSIADVVPGSTSRGIAVQAGDEVIYPGAGI